MNRRRFNASNPRDRRPVYRAGVLVGFTEPDRSPLHVFVALDVNGDGVRARCVSCDGSGRDSVIGEQVRCTVCNGTGRGPRLIFGNREDAEERLRLDAAARQRDASRP